MSTLTRTILAERTHIYVDWLAPTLTGSIHFDNVCLLGLPGSPGFAAKDAQPAPPLTIDVADALAYSVTLPGPVTAITGEHVAMFLRRLHAERIEAVLNPPEPEAASV